MNRTTPSGKTQPEFLVPVRSFVVTLIHIGLVLLLALPAVFLPACADAQEFRATISGAVSDPTGAVVPGTAVTATEITTGSVSKTTADSAGQYVIPFLAPGTYRIEAQAEGFQKVLRNAVTLQAGDHPVINLALTVGNASQTVSVSTAAPLIDQSNASIGQVITTSQIADLPLNGRTPIQLTELSIGVIDTGTPTQVRAFDNNAANAWSIGGTPSQTSEILLDGNPDTTWAGALAYSPTQDAVQEVSVSVFNTDASFGHTIGGVMNQITKTGTNRLHGTVYEFGQASDLDANTTFNDQKGIQKPVTHYNQYGFTIGGPVFVPKVIDGRDKLFFFFAWEGLKDSQPTTAFNTVPTAAERNGDFSALLTANNSCPSGSAYNPATGLCSNGAPDAFQLYNPFTATLNAKGVVTRTAIPNNNITNAGPLSKVAQSFLQFYPMPNTAGNSDGLQNYVSNAPSIDTYNNEFGRMDWNASARNHIFVDVRHNNRVQTKGVFFPNDATGTTLLRENFGATVDEVFTVNPTTVIDIRPGWTYFDEVHGTPAQAYSPSTVGLPSSLSSASLLPQLPFIQFGSCGSMTSFQCLGDNGSSKDPSTEYQLFADVVKILGRHTLKVGTDLRQYRLDVINYGDSSGSFTTSTNYVSQGGTNTAAPTFGGDFASFLLGLPTSGDFVQAARASYHQWYTAGFVQDDWRVNNQLTLNMGIRFDHDTPYEEKLGRTVNGFNATAALPITGAALSAYAAKPIAQLPAGSFNPVGGLTFPNGTNGAPYQTTSHLFSPRFGFSFSPTELPNTVIRGGFGMFVQPDVVSNLASSGTYSSNAITNQEGFSSTTTFVPTNNSFLTAANTLDNPFPNGFVAPTGSSLGAATNLGQTISFLAPREKDPYSLRWNLGIQHSFGSKLLAEVAYIANTAVNLPVAATQLNPVPAQFLSTQAGRDQALITAYQPSVANPFAGLLPGTSLNGATTSIPQLLSVHPQFPTSGQGFSNGVIEQNNTIGRSYFESVDARIEKRLDHGLSIIANYGFSKLIEADTYLNDTDTTLNRRISPFDHTQHFVVASTYDLPFGKGRTFNTNSRLVDTIIGGFRVNGIYTYQTGAPIFFSADIPLLPGNSINNIAVNNRQIVGNSLSNVFQIANGSVNNGGQFQYHIRTLPQTISSVRQDGINNLDASILKDFHFTESTYFQLRFETFNTVNHPTYGPSTVSSATSSAFGTITTQANTPRQVQIGGRIVF
jgi:hypothetical protein